MKFGKSLPMPENYPVFSPLRPTQSILEIQHILTGKFEQLLDPTRHSVFRLWVTILSSCCCRRIHTPTSRKFGQIKKLYLQQLQ